jgi:CheY-like chemotaxis protein
MATLGSTSTFGTQVLGNPNTLHGRTVLIVEDEPLIAFELRAVLGDEGAIVFAATTSKEAIELIVNGHFRSNRRRWSWCRRLLGRLPCACRSIDSVHVLYRRFWCHRIASLAERPHDKQTGNDRSDHDRSYETDSSELIAGCSPDPEDAELADA